MSAPPGILPDLNLQPGQLYLAREPAILRTLLGSCVGVTFWCRKLGAGALCHGVLPRYPGKWPVNSATPDANRYVDFSIHYLAREFKALGVKGCEIEVKVFGGADVLDIGKSARSRPTVGAQNCAAAMETLAAEGLTISACDVGGRRGRRVDFHTGTGEVLLRRLGECKEPC
jgi:chemotaxis protein CheD